MFKSIICFLLLTILTPARLASVQTPPSPQPVEAEDDLIVEVRQAGQCNEPVRAEIGKSITVHYDGFLVSTNVKFDSSKDRDEPMTFTLGKGEVIPGWEQGLVGMCLGEERVLIVAPELAYGAKGFEDVIPPNAALKFEVILLDVQ